MGIFIVPLIFIGVAVIAIIKKVPLYDSFVEGARDGLKLAVSVFPYLAVMFIAIELMRISGLTAIMSKAFEPILGAFGIPVELSELLIVRPLSGSGSMAIVSNIYNQYGVDSYIARCASVIVGCSETVFYVTTVYFASTKIKKTGYCLPISILSCYIGAVIACLICRVM